ncbi:MAG: SRPBCC family protein [Flavobacteriales bacterium]|nr:SRPBCC family protein [Flavobacteriales bacterium]
MLKKILLGLLAVIAVIIIVSRFQPDTYTVERSATIEAPPSVVFTQLNDFRNWEKFNPWADADPNARYTYEGPATGAGSVYLWEGNKEFGKGRFTITESKPDEYIKVDMRFIEPFEGAGVVEYRMAPAQGGTHLTETMTGEHSWMSKIMCLFVSFDDMLGEKFEEGHRRMNTVMRGIPVETMDLEQ